MSLGLGALSVAWDTGRFYSQAMAGGRGTAFGQAKITRGCLYLLSASVALSAFFLISKDEMRAEIARFSAASGQSLWVDLKLWQVFTSPLLQVEFVGLLFQGFMLWMFIPSLERWWGTKRFLKFAAYTSVIAVVVGTLTVLLVPSISRSYPITGLDPFIYASIVAYGTLFANQEVQFFGVVPMTGRQLTIGICAFMLIFVVVGQAWGKGAANVAAMLTAWILTNGGWTPKIWWLKRKQKRIRKKLRVVRESDDPNSYLN